MMPPRAQLMIRTPSFIVAMLFALTICFVSAIRGVWTVMTSATLKRSAMDIISTPSWAARSLVMNGSYATTFMSIAIARLASSRPIRPKPTIPSVFSFSSLPMNFERFHSFFFRLAFACGILRASESIIAIVCSVAARVFPSGALATMIPLPGCCFHIDIVHTDTGTPDELQLSCLPRSPLR